MNAFIVVPEMGEGAIEKILDADHVSDYTPPDGYKLVEIERPGVPISTIHWDGEAIASGAYVSEEDQAAAEARAAEKEAQELLNSRLSTFDYDLTTSLIARMSPNADLETALSGATTVEELKTIVSALLQKLSLTEAELSMMNGYREKYEAWLAAQS